MTCFKTCILTCAKVFVMVIACGLATEIRWQATLPRRQKGIIQRCCSQSPVKSQKVDEIRDVIKDLQLYDSIHDSIIWPSKKLHKLSTASQSFMLAKQLYKSTPEGWLSMPGRLQSCWLCHFYHADGHPNAFCSFELVCFHDSQTCLIDHRGWEKWIEIELISGAQDKDRWIDLDLDPGADWGPFSPTAMVKVYEIIALRWLGRECPIETVTLAFLAAATRLQIMYLDSFHLLIVYQILIHFASWSSDAAHRKLWWIDVNRIVLSACWQTSIW